MNTLRYLIAVGLLALAYLAPAEIVTITPNGFQATSTAYTNTYISITNSTTGASIFIVMIQPGEVARILASSQNGTLGLGYGTNINDVTYNTEYAWPIYGYTIWQSAVDDVIVGPGFIRQEWHSVNRGTATAQITRNSETITPSGAVMVPSDSSGSVQVILESSTNLIAWASALPGNYGSTSQNMFFRVRAVRQTP